MRFPIWKESIELKLRLEQKIYNLYYEWTLQVCILFIVVTSKSALACWGWGGSGPADMFEGAILMNLTRINATLPVPNMDEKFFVNLTGISDPVERIIKSAWNGWKPDNATQMSWQRWYAEYKACKEKYEGDDGKKKKKKKKIKVEINEPLDCTKYGFPAPGGAHGAGDSWGPGSGGVGGPGGSESDYNEDYHRGPGSGWPDSPAWKGLGKGSAGVPIPPWAYVPKNVGKMSLCYLSPTRGKCQQNLIRWGYNPYTDQCEKYTYSGCGGTRNRFTTQEICEKHCMQPLQPSCSADSGIKETVFKFPEK